MKIKSRFSQERRLRRLIDKNYFKEKKGTLAIGGGLLEWGECYDYKICKCLTH